MTEKFAFYKGKLVAKSEIDKENAQAMPPAPVPPVQAPMQQPPRQFAQPATNYDAEKAREDMELLMRQQMAQEEQMAPVEPQGADIKVTVFLIEGLKMEVNVPVGSSKEFFDGINEAIATQCAFQIGNKVVNGRHIIFYHVQ